MAAPNPAWVVQTLQHIRRAIRTKGLLSTGPKVLLLIGKIDKAIPEEQIDDLARIASKPGGLKKVGKLLGKSPLIVKCPEKLRPLVLQDAYLRIAVKNKKISAELAQEVLSRMHGTPGLTSLIRKINASNINVTKGHLQELQIALQAQKRGFTPVSLGQRFADGLKKGDTDLDILLRRGPKNFALESKAYTGTVKTDMIMQDAESLLAFCRNIDDTIPVFCFTSEPPKLAQYFLHKKNIMTIVGNTPQEIAAKLDMLTSSL